MRDKFVATLRELAIRDPRVVLLTGDLGFGVLTDYQKEFPRQYINVGVAEQNLAGLATGLALSGHTVFTYSIANFPTLRCLEQVRNDICYHRAPVKIVAIGGGFSYGALGISHHATEDLAIMRSLPEMTVFCPGDLREAVEVTIAAYERDGPCYLRLDKSYAATDDAAEQEFTVGRMRRMRPGDEVVILGTGGVLNEALVAARELERDGIRCGVFSVHTIKPLDVTGIVEAGRQASLVVTLEEHTLFGGLGSAVLEAFCESGTWPRAMLRVGLRAGFSSLVGDQNYLRRQYGLDAASLTGQIRQALDRRCGVSSPEAR